MADKVSTISKGLIVPLSLTTYTIGHSTRTVEDFIRLLKENKASRVVDIRTIPRSRHNLQFNYLIKALKDVR